MLRVHSTAKHRGSKLARQPAVLGLILGAAKNFILMLLRFIDGTAWNSRQRLNNVNRTHLVLASGKLVLQKHSIKYLLFTFLLLFLFNYPGLFQLLISCRGDC